jgi:hypothetical protein
VAGIETSSPVILLLRTPQLPEGTQLFKRVLVPVHPQVGDCPRDVFDDGKTC